MRLKDETLYARLLEISEKIATKEGPEALSIRALAKQADVSVGTVYNYFENKEDILLTLNQSYWAEVLQELDKIPGGASFLEYLREVYVFLQGKLTGTSRLWMRSLQNLQMSGQERMRGMQEILAQRFQMILERDEKVSQNVWDKTLDMEQFSMFVVDIIILSFRTRNRDIEPLIEIVRRTLYL